MFVYPNDEMISPKSPIKASAIRRLQNMDQGEAAQNDQQDNQVGNDEGSVLYLVMGEVLIKAFGPIVSLGRIIAHSINGRSLNTHMICCTFQVP